MTSSTPLLILMMICSNQERVWNKVHKHIEPNEHEASQQAW